MFLQQICPLCPLTFWTVFLTPVFLYLSKINLVYLNVVFELNPIPLPLFPSPSSPARIVARGTWSDQAVWSALVPVYSSSFEGLISSHTSPHSPQPKLGFVGSREEKEPSVFLLITHEHCPLLSSFPPPHLGCSWPLCRGHMNDMYKSLLMDLSVTFPTEALLSRGNRKKCISQNIVIHLSIIHRKQAKISKSQLNKLELQ